VNKLFNQDSAAQEIKEFIGDLDRRLRDELASAWFMHLDKKEADLYNGKDLFGENVSNNFPSTVREIEEAGKCLALA